MNKIKKLDIIFLIILPIFATWFSFIIRANYLESTLLFFGLPAVWFSFRMPKKILKVGIFSSLLVLPFITVVDQIGIRDFSWVVPNTVFPFTFFGLTPIENLFQGFFLSFSVIMYYEYFFEEKKDHLFGKRIKYFFELFIPIILIFILLLIFKQQILYIPYAYFWLGSLFVLIPILLVYKYSKKLFDKLCKVCFYFFPLILLSEIVGVKFNQWTFPSQHYVGWVQMFGVRFPFEELIFWCLFISIASLVYYEFFDDNLR